MTIDEAIKQFEERLQIPDYKTQIPEYYEAMELAVEVLEKQIPKKMEQKAHPDFPHMGKFWHCTCGVYYLESGGNYCGNCGQRLEWGKEEC